MKKHTSLDSFKEKVVELLPRQAKQVALGAYAQSESEPRFSLVVTPKDHSLSYSLERIDIPDSNRYVMYYQLQNFSDKSCRVAVLLR